MKYLDEILLFYVDLLLYAVEPAISGHPKCKDFMAAYGR